MPLRLPQGSFGISDLVCRRINFVGDNSVIEGLDPFTPTRIVLPQVNEPLTPTLTIGTGGFFETAGGALSVSIAGTRRFLWLTNTFRGDIAGSAAILNVSPSGTLPSSVPSNADLDTGMGTRASDIGVLIAGAQNCMEFGEAGGAPLVAFYGAAAIALQTGVAVTAAGIHAALVNLNLITA